MKKTILAAVAVLAACGGNGSTLDPNTVKFTYGAASTPAAGSPEASAATTGETALATAPAAPTTTDPALGDPNAASIISLPEAMSSQLMGSSTTVMSAQTGAAQKALAVGMGRLTPAGAGFDNPACVSVTPGVITYSGCKITVPNTTGATETITVNGTVTRAVAGAVANVGWDLRTHFTSTDPSMTLALDMHQTGAIAITAPAITTDPWTLVGSARSDTDVNVSANGMSVSASVTVLAGYDLQFVNDPSFCVTGGTIELRRVWTKRPTGVTTAQVPDEGILFTWNGCGNVNVAWGTRQ